MALMATKPPMGWNAWNYFGPGKINEQVVRETADAMVEQGFRDAGYTYVSVDDCWMALERDANGDLQANPETFPSGMKALGDYIHERGLKFGLYYSQELDWHEPNGGGYTNHEPCAGVSWDNSWDFKDAEKKNFDRCFAEKIKPQVEEILTGYGDLCLIWFDVPHTISPAQSLELNNLVKHYQPNCLINSRIGNGAYDYVSLGDNEIPQEPPEEALESQNMNDLAGYKFSPYGLYETAGTMNDSWGFRYYDQNWKTPEAIAENRKKLNSLGVNYLLNMGPDGLGRMPSMAVENLRKAAELMQ